MKLGTLLLATGLLAGCAATAPRTMLTAPSCYKLDAHGTAEVEKGNALVFDHTWDLPFRRRTVTVTEPTGSWDKEISSDYQDPYRLCGGGCLMCLGGLNIAGGLLSTTTAPATAGNSIWIGSAICLLGGAAALIGWHPDQREMILSGTCEMPPPLPPTASPPIPGSQQSPATPPPQAQ